jgi:hypothetical protein
MYVNNLKGELHRMAKNLGFYPAKSFTKGRGRWSGLQDIIVFHQTDGAAGLEALERNPKFNPALFTGSFGWFCIPTTTATTSSHFITDRGGRYVQIVRFFDMAHCNGNNADMRRQSGVKDIIKNRVDNANLYTYSIECEGYKAVGDPPGTDEQLDAMIEVMYLCIDDMYNNGCKTFRPDADHIIGHCHISPVSRKGCPSANFGEKFPWETLITKAKEYCVTKYPNWIPNLLAVNTVDETPVVNDEIGLGDTVGIIPGATWYGSTSKINSAYITGKRYTVDGLSGNRAVLDKKGVNSPIDVKYLKLVKKAVPVVVDVNGNVTYKVGDKAKINAGATWYGSTKSVPSWAIGQPYTIDELTGTRAVIDKKGLNSPIDIKFLTKI